MLLTIALLLFATFGANVVMGSMGLGGFLGDVSEMLTLFAATIFFVAVILQKEAAEKKSK
ncbi:hypothetical protein DS909_00880 [Phaeobacter gallaeciensis]|uniref:Uncharacterized protein n=2 Tax=Roseobacteraceae TaxID=2854170 RepID=A0A366XF35_9RHOB|nr:MULTISPECIES: hypothetical protein [Roseobacteraceae]MBT3140461.1 hypothetical protein [Falsiruegeria litorea]MBT8169636.1 hypothetical protein [Falsiruegeria litorea]RBW62193.1 hypothetical protein DS909_00880 [Phaeobacter gallaeciensis]